MSTPSEESYEGTPSSPIEEEERDEEEEEEEEREEEEEIQMSPQEEASLEEMTLREMLEAGVHKMGKKKVKFFEEREARPPAKGMAKGKVVPVFVEKEVPTFSGPLQEMAKRMGLGKTSRIVEEEEMIEEGEEYQELLNFIEKERIEEEARIKRLREKPHRKVEKVPPPKRGKLVHIGEKLPPKARLQELKTPHRKQKQPTRQKKLFRPSDMYNLNVPEKMRELLIDLYTPHISVNTKSWLEYYEENFAQWRYALHHPKILASLNLRDIEERAKEKVQKNFAKSISAEFYIGTLNNLFEDGNFALHTSDEVYKKLDVIHSPTAFEEYMIQHLQGVHQKGEAFEETAATLIFNYIQYLSTRQNDLYDSYYRALIEKDVRQQFEKLPITEEEKKQFDSENLLTLKKLYEDANPASLSRDSIIKFENAVYDESRGVYRYLEDALRPYMYLRGVLSPYAKVFGAKVKSGKYNIVADANLAIFFPELAIGIYNMKDVAPIERALKSLLKSEVDSFIYLYRRYEHPGEHVRAPPTQHVLEDLKIITKYTVVPQDACLRFSNILETKDPYTRALYLELFGEESIADEDLAVCLLGGKFVCSSLTEMREKFKRGDFVDVVSGLTYPRSVIDRVLA